MLLCRSPLVIADLHSFGCLVVSTSASVGWSGWRSVCWTRCGVVSDQCLSLPALFLTSCGSDYDGCSRDRDEAAVKHIARYKATISC
jgi:hypothetical protein